MRFGLFQKTRESAVFYHGVVHITPNQFGNFFDRLAFIEIAFEVVIPIPTKTVARRAARRADGFLNHGAPVPLKNERQPSTFLCRLKETFRKPEIRRPEPQSVGICKLLRKRIERTANQRVILFENLLLLVL